MSDTLRALYDEVLAHYRSCPPRDVPLSDTWVQTLRHRGHLYEFDDMMRMLSPGNTVNFWIDDLQYLIDQTALDQSDPVVRRLLELGESEFGAPRKDLVIEGRSMASNFLHYVGYAARIIHAIEARGLREPSILEIGGGLGGLASILRRYYGERLTLYLADIPETLLIQEWYLRACFPEAAWTYKASEAPAAFRRGGINFINAYVLDSQDLALDAAINTDSMQEMTRETAEAYLRYLERNIAPGGFFYFQNHYGHSTSSVPEPSEYRLDANWTIEAAELASQMDCCAESEQARFIFARAPQPESVETRTLVLRLLWNGLVTGRIANSPALVRELAGVPRRCAASEAVPQIEQILRRHGVAIGQDLLAPLVQARYFPPASFVSLYGVAPVPTRQAKDLKQRHAEAVWATQSAVLQLMEAAADAPAAWPAEALRARLKQTCGEQLLPLGDTARSEYWSAYVACLLLVLGHRKPAIALLAECARGSSNPFWLTRFAYLLMRFGQCAQAHDMLQRSARAPRLDYYVALKCAELEQAAGDAESARRRLELLARENGWDSPRLATLARTAARVGAADVLQTTCRAVWDQLPSSRVSVLLGVLRASTSEAPARAIVRDLVGRLGSDPGTSDPVASGALLVELGEREEGLQQLMGAVQGCAGDYYKLGLAGKFLQEAGADQLADACLERSLALRPDSFLHHDFVGNIYLGARRYAQALAQYERSIALNPYLRHIQAKRLFCRLPETVRAAEVFGAPSDLALVFQRKQDFYHDLGLSNK